MDFLPFAVAGIIPIPGFSEPFSSLSHLVGAGVAAVLSPGLIRRGRGSSGRVTALALFAFSCALLLAVSGVYHLLTPETTARVVMQRVDHAAIFVLIAGTITAAHAILFCGLWRWGMIVLIWLLAATGIVLKVFFFEGVSEALGLGFYLGMGWIGVISGVRVWRLYGGELLRPLIAGGLAYTAGAVLEFCRWPELAPGILGPHELFHLCVLAGVGFHWVFVNRFADGQRVARRDWGPPAPIPT